MNEMRIIKVSKNQRNSRMNRVIILKLIVWIIKFRDLKMQKNSRTNSIKPKDLNEDYDLYFSDEETTFQQPLQDYQTLNYANMNGQQIRSRVSTEFSKSVDLQFNPHNENQNELKKSSKLNLTSLTDFYNNHILNIQSSKKKTSFEENIRYKNYINNCNLQKRKIDIISKLLIQEQSKDEFTKLKQSILKQSIQNNKKKPFQIIFSKCSCGKAFLSYKNVNRHLKLLSHNIIFSINTKNTRKHQQKLYIQFGQDLKNQNFINSCLYKSFQLFFLQGIIHHTQINQNSPFLKNILKIKNQEQLFNSQKENLFLDQFFRQWTELYHLLHQVHKGDQRNCHKCLSLEQHLSLFMLGVSQMVVRNNQLLYPEEEQVKTSSVVRFLSVIFKRLKDPYSVSSKNKPFPKYNQTKKQLANLLRRYWKSFSYIDIYQWPFSNDHWNKNEIF